MKYLNWQVVLRNSPLLHWIVFRSQTKNIRIAAQFQIIFTGFQTYTIFGDPFDDTYICIIIIIIIIIIYNWHHAHHGISSVYSALDQHMLFFHVIVYWFYEAEPCMPKSLISFGWMKRRFFTLMLQPCRVRSRHLALKESGRPKQFFLFTNISFEHHYICSGSFTSNHLSQSKSHWTIRLPWRISWWSDHRHMVTTLLGSFHFSFVTYLNSFEANGVYIRDNIAI